MLPLSNELKSSQKLTEHIKIILHPKFKRKRNKGDILWRFEFSTKYYDLTRENELLDLYWPQCWRAYSCPPTWRPKLLFPYILLNV